MTKFCKHHGIALHFSSATLQLTPSVSVGIILSTRRILQRVVLCLRETNDHGFSEPLFFHSSLLPSSSSTVIFFYIGLQVKDKTDVVSEAWSICVFDCTWIYTRKPDTTAGIECGYKCGHG